MELGSCLVTYLLTYLVVHKSDSSDSSRQTDNRFLSSSAHKHV